MKKLIFSLSVLSFFSASCMEHENKEKTVPASKTVYVQTVIKKSYMNVEGLAQTATILDVKKKLKDMVGIPVDLTKIVPDYSVFFWLV